MPEWPSGTVTFLFTDIADSTALWERGRAAMASAVARHLALFRDAVAAHDAQPTCWRDSFRVAKVYNAPRRKSSQPADAGRAFGSLTSSSAQRMHGPDRSRDARILVAARLWTSTST